METVSCSRQKKLASFFLFSFLLFSLFPSFRLPLSLLLLALHNFEAPPTLRLIMPRRRGSKAKIEAGRRSSRRLETKVSSPNRKLLCRFNR
jgi:hypothetical protein